MNRIDILAYKFDSVTSDDFNNDVISYSRNSIILNWNLNKIWVQYKPDNIKLNKKTIEFFTIRNQRLRYFLLPFVLLVYVVQVFKFFLLICWKFRPKIFIVENYLEGVIAGFIRRCQLVDKTIYMPADWFGGMHNKKLISRMANNLFFPYVDYLACKLNDVILERESTITEKRNKYWCKEIHVIERAYLPQIRIQTTNVSIDKKRNSICFIGKMREDSGLDIAIKALSKIRIHLDATLKIIGPEQLYYENLMKLTQEYGLTRYVNFLGFVERKDFNEVLSDCFCGISIFTSKDSHSVYGVPSKIMYYLQYLLPVVITKGVNKNILADIREKELGVIIEPNEEEFINAISKVHFEQTRYRKNIINYVESFPKTGLKDCIEI